MVETNRILPINERLVTWWVNEFVKNNVSNPCVGPANTFALTPIEL